VAQYLENPRKAPRARLRCRVRASSGSARFEAVTEDLGPIGCQLVAPCQLAPGSPVALVVHADGLTTPLEVVGVVAWSSAREPWRFGVAFEDEEHPAAAAFFAALAAAHPGLSDWQRVPARIPLDATVWLAPPPRRVVDFGPDEVAVLRAVGSGATVFELLARLRDRGTAGQRAFFSLLAGRHVTLLRGGAVPVANWSSLLRTLEVAQLVRAHVLLIVPSDFVEASRALGASRRWQLRTHVLPRLTQPLAVNLLLGAATLVGLEAALGLVGLGLPRGVPSWGSGLGALAAGGRAAPVAAVIASIGTTCAALYGLAISLERRQRRAPGYAARGVETLRELGAEGRGS